MPEHHAEAAPANHASAQIDFSLAAKLQTKAAANLNSALHEAASMAAGFQAALMVAQLSALQAWPAACDIQAARQQLAAIDAHLRFCAALAERAERVRA